MLLFAALAGLAACDAPPATAPPVTRTPASPTVPPTPSTPAEVDGAPPGLVDRTWRVTASDAVARGTRYTFRSDGTLVVRRGGDPPGVGQWTWDDGRLTMIEEGIAYPTDLALDGDQLVLVSHNPGGDLRIELAADPRP